MRGSVRRSVLLRSVAVAAMVVGFASGAVAQTVISSSIVPLATGGTGVLRVLSNGSTQLTASDGSTLTTTVSGTGASYTFSGATFGGTGSGQYTVTSLSATSVQYNWTQTVNGVTSSGSCTVNSQTGAVSGNCGLAGPVGTTTTTATTTATPSTTAATTAAVAVVASAADHSLSNPANQSSLSATSEVLLRTEAAAIVRGLASRVAQITGMALRLQAGESLYNGVSAGNMTDGQFATWGSLSGTRMRQGGAGTNFDGRLFSALLGADYAFDGFVTGLALGVSRASLDTKYNNGDLTTDGYTIAPYFGVALTDWLTADVNVGYGRIGKESSRAFGAVRGDTNADRLFGAANLTAYHDVDAFRLQGGVGYTLATERTDGFRESNGTQVPGGFNRLGTLSVGGRVGYDLGGWTPYVSGKVLYDVQRSESTGLNPTQKAALDDRSAFEVGGGFDYVAGNFVVSGEVTTELGRDELTSTTGLVSLRYRF